MLPASKVAEQTAIMRSQVEHHLNRARIAAQANVLGAVTPIEPALSALVRVMGKVHQARDLAIEVEVSPELRFRGEKQDFEEMAGNLLDNACKWAKSRVRVSTRRGDGRRPFIVLTIDDDGPGLPAKDRDAALSRGHRLDESKPGSGLGLSIVAELAGIYGGGLALDGSELGGLTATLTLPAIGE
jgi:signal transduction histidine kinase